MDILYIVGRGSGWNNNELRYSLRSLDKHGINVGRIFIAAPELPDFINQKAVTWVPADDPTDRNHKNIQHKVERAIYGSDIGDHFLLSSDDHFYVRDTDFDNYPYYKKGNLPTQLTENHNNGYWESLVNTRKILERFALGTFSTNPHCNTHYDKQAYIENQLLMDTGYLSKAGAEVNCMMGNILAERGAKYQNYRDVKIYHIESREHLLKQIGQNHCFSISDVALEEGMKEYLQELYPNKSRYEL